jgi:hypothetical protein
MGGAVIEADGRDKGRGGDVIIIRMGSKGRAGLSAHGCCVWQGVDSKVTCRGVLTRGILGTADEQDFPPAYRR